MSKNEELQQLLEQANYISQLNREMNELFENISWKKGTEKYIEIVGKIIEKLKEVLKEC